jgi:hypothetical protein
MSLGHRWLVKRVFSLPLADARGSVPATPVLVGRDVGRDREGAVSAVA